jgi:hypothetical protein
MPRVNIDLGQKGDWKVAPIPLRGVKQGAWWQIMNMSRQN